jgi:hypothetical protein
MLHCNICVTNHHKIPQILKLRFFILKGMRKIEKILYHTILFIRHFVALLASSSCPKPMQNASYSIGLRAW